VPSYGPMRLVALFVRTTSQEHVMQVHLTARFVVGALVGLAGILLVPGSSRELLAAQKTGSGTETPLSNPKMASTDALMRTLDQEISTKDLPVSFYPLLDYLTEKMREVGKELTFFVDVRAFSKDVQDVVDGLLPPPRFKLQPLPSRMSVRAILQMAVNQFDGDEATFLIRQGRVEITTK